MEMRPEGAREIRFSRPFRAHLTFARAGGSRSALTTGYPLAPLRGAQAAESFTASQDDTALEPHTLYATASTNRSTPAVEGAPRLGRRDFRRGGDESRPARGRHRESRLRSQSTPSRHRTSP